MISFRSENCTFINGAMVVALDHRVLSSCSFEVDIWLVQRYINLFPAVRMDIYKLETLKKWWFQNDAWFIIFPLSWPIYAFLDFYSSPSFVVWRYGVDGGLDSSETAFPRWINNDRVRHFFLEFGSKGWSCREAKRAKNAKINHI